MGQAAGALAGAGAGLRAKQSEIRLGEQGLCLGGR